ncbi:TPA: hypothetical protein JYW19_000208 [Escherichia coli]|nr:hypothetical protein [Escherichia coli]HAW9008304.1 hypothetical protein [Escherichia coli]
MREEVDIMIMVTRKIREGHEYNWMRIRVMECVKIERENEGQRWMINKGVDTNYSNKPKLKLSMFDE